MGEEKETKSIDGLVHDGNHAFVVVFVPMNDYRCGKVKANAISQSQFKEFIMSRGSQRG